MEIQIRSAFEFCILASMAILWRPVKLHRSA